MTHRLPTPQDTAPQDTTPYAALVLRIALGTMFVAHAMLKYAVFTLPGTVKFFESIGLPGPLAYVTFFAELIGGALILAGVGTRSVALALVPILLRDTLRGTAQFLDRQPDSPLTAPPKPIRRSVSEVLERARGLHRFSGCFGVAR